MAYRLCFDRAQILVFEISVPIIQGTSVMFHHLQTIQPGTITKLISLLDKTTQAVSKAKPRTITSNSLACVEIELMDPVCVKLAKAVEAQIVLNSIQPRGYRKQHRAPEL